jgi:radical SAM superfamily enzyme YgiQ (UPF0313 family)
MSFQETSLRPEAAAQRAGARAYPPQRVLLIYPEIPETYWSYRHSLSFVGKKALMPPLGLLTVAAIMGEGYEYRLVDMNVRELEDADLEWADMALISAMIVQRPSMEEVIRRCNQASVPVTAGGPYPSSCYQEIEGVDHFVLGEGECTIPQFREDLEQGRPQDVYHPNGRPEIDEVPVPRFDLCEVGLYETMPLQFSRGCPFDCEFCDIVNLFGHRVRTKSPRQFVAEMDAAYRTGFRGSLFIVDDNFIGRRSHAKALLREIAVWQKARGYPFQLSTEASIDLATDRELLDLLASAGFVMVFVGLETPDRDSLQEVGKQQNLRLSMPEAVRRIQRTGIEVTGGFIIGFDSDPPDIADRQIRFIRQLGIPTAMVGLLMALPNTRLWSRLEREGRILSQSQGNNTHAVELNFRTRIPKKQLLDAYHRVLREVYEPREYFRRCLTLLRRFPKPQERTKSSQQRSIRMRDLRAFGRSLWRQGFSSYGHWYWWYLLRALAMKPRLIVRIVTMAVQGHHYFVITSRVLRSQQRSKARARSEQRRRVTEPSQSRQHALVGAPPENA